MDWRATWSKTCLTASPERCCRGGLRAEAKVAEAAKLQMDGTLLLLSPGGPSYGCHSVAFQTATWLRHLAAAALGS